MNNTVTYKCPNCEAGLLFDAAKQKFACEFCLSEFSEAELSKEENKAREQERAERDRQFDASVKEYICASCGAEVITDESTVAGECYYCHNPIVLSSKISGGLRPDKIIPFKFDKTEAKNIFLRYSKKKWFVPNDYFSEAHADKITGIYYPFWVTDADTYAGLVADGRIVRSWSSGNYRYTEVSKYRIERGGDIHFEDISTSAISEEDKKMLEGILPYPSDAHVDFSIPYLQGFVAKKRNIERDTLIPEVRGRMSSYADELLRSTVRGYTGVETRAVDVNVKKSHWQYTLMPIWILTYKKKGKNYTYAMNGSTGKLYGELPVSLFKLCAVAGGIFALLATLFSLLGWFLA